MILGKRVAEAHEKRIQPPAHQHEAHHHQLDGTAQTSNKQLKRAKKNVQDQGNINDDPDVPDEAEHDEEEEDDVDEIAIDINAKKAKQSKLTPTTTAAEVTKTSSTHISDNRKQGADQPFTSAASEEEEDMINVEFGLFDPLPDDDLTFRVLLKDYIPEHIQLPYTTTHTENGETHSLAPFTLHAFCSLLAQQALVGSTIKADGTEEPLGLLTILNIRHHHQQPCIQQIHHYFLHHIHNQAHKQQYLKVYSAAMQGQQQVGLLVSSRLLNIPQQLVGPLYTALIEDLDWAVKQEGAPGEAESSPSHPKQQFHFDRILVLGRCFHSIYSSRLHTNSDSQSHKQKKKKHKPDIPLNNNSSDLLYYRFEEELIARASEWCTRWNVPVATGSSSNETEEDSSIPAGAVLMCITMDKLRQVVTQIQEMMADA